MTTPLDSNKFLSKPFEINSCPSKQPCPFQDKAKSLIVRGIISPNNLPISQKKTHYTPSPSRTCSKTIALSICPLFKQNEETLAKEGLSTSSLLKEPSRTVYNEGLELLSRGTPQNPPTHNNTVIPYPYINTFDDDNSKDSLYGSENNKPTLQNPFALPSNLKSHKMQPNFFYGNEIQWFHIQSSFDRLKKTCHKKMYFFKHSQTTDAFNKKTLQSAEKLFYEGKYDKALTYLNKLSEKNFNLPDLFYLKAFTCAMTHNFELAHTYCSTASLIDSARKRPLLKKQLSTLRDFIEHLDTIKSIAPPPSYAPAPIDIRLTKIKIWIYYHVINNKSALFPDPREVFKTINYLSYIALHNPHKSHQNSAKAFLKCLVNHYSILAKKDPRASLILGYYELKFKDRPRNAHIHLKDLQISDADALLGMMLLFGHGLNPNIHLGLIRLKRSKPYSFIATFFLDEYNSGKQDSYQLFCSDFELKINRNAPLGPQYELAAYKGSSKAKYLHYKELKKSAKHFHRMCSEDWLEAAALEGNFDALFKYAKNLQNQKKSKKIAYQYYLAIVKQTSTQAVLPLVHYKAYLELSKIHWELSKKQESLINLTRSKSYALNIIKYKNVKAADLKKYRQIKGNAHYYLSLICDKQGLEVKSFQYLQKAFKYGCSQASSNLTNMINKKNHRR